MGILFTALIFGLVVLFVLLRFMSNVGAQIKGTTSEKIRAILKIVLLIEDVLFILVFIAVIIKTLIL
ncbi:MAG: hypothetical protein IJL99_02565 [Firmicutes bacterium]|nr:hypothetical protein [Bacillota bacterium]